jgi:transposase
MYRVALNSGLPLLWGSSSLSLQARQCIRFGFMRKSMPGHELLPPSSLLTLTTLERNDDGWTVRAEGPDHAHCPRCRQVSTARHSRYVRTLKDLPALGAAVSLRLCVGRWRCRHPGCAVRFFTGALPGVAEVHGRRTSRADVMTDLIGHALGGRAGERLMGRLGLPVSDDTILRRIKKRARPAVIGARVVGVDEWAKRKGLHYGTIVVDLERRTVVDVLDTYDVEAVEHWFSAHPHIHTICRDRNGRYAKAARTGAPTATQVADRFHLVQNLRETIERELAVHRAHLRVGGDGRVAPASPLAAPVIGPSVNLPVTARERLLWPARRLALDTEIARQRRQQMQDLFDRFKGLQATKVPMSVIAHQLGFNRRRFDRWAKVDALPTRSPMPPRRRSAEPFRAYLRGRWDAGYCNGRMLFDEIHARGYTGTHKTLNKIVSPWRRGNIAFESHAPFPLLASGAPASGPSVPSTPASPPPSDTNDPTARQISPQIAAALLAKPRPELTSPQAAIVDALKAGCPGYAVMRPLMLGFRSLLRHPTIPSQKKRTTIALHRWMDRAQATGIRSIQNFVGRLRLDVLAVEAAVIERWSKGPVEGQVNRLKTLKRQMYGRAGVELLRARLIPLPAATVIQQRE